MLNIFWFRKDLRIFDNNGLDQFLNSLNQNDSFCFIYIKNNTKSYSGEMRNVFLLESLKDLNENLNKISFELQIFQGESVNIFRRIINKHPKLNLNANYQVEPYCIKRDKYIKDFLKQNGCGFNIYSDNTVYPVNTILKDDKTPYTIFTPFKNKFHREFDLKYISECKSNFRNLSKLNEVSLELPKFEIENNIKSKTNIFIHGGRKNGLGLLKKFSPEKISKYSVDRNYPSKDSTSYLSPHIHFGTVSIRECFRHVLDYKDSIEDVWINELIWREFYYNISYNFKHILNNSFKKAFDNIQWDINANKFSKWCNGETGYPIVDAGMMQLNSEGWMHNRVRMITAMFLTKDLLIDWRQGEKYFAEKLIDLDFSSNNGGWQWSASTGCDAQPYFRVMNPELQSKKFDADGLYIKKYIPELGNLPSHLIHSPHLVNGSDENKFNFKIGKTYPLPIVNHNEARKKVIGIFAALINKK